MEGMWPARVGWGCRRVEAYLVIGRRHALYQRTHHGDPGFYMLLAGAPRQLVQQGVYLADGKGICLAWENGR